MQLSIEGERLLKAGDYNGAIDFFEAGEIDRGLLTCTLFAPQTIADNLARSSSRN